MPGNLVFLYKARGSLSRAKAIAGGGTTAPVRQKRGSLLILRSAQSSRFVQAHADDSVTLLPSCSVTSPERPCLMLVSRKLCAEKEGGLCLAREDQQPPASVSPSAPPVCRRLWKQAVPTGSRALTEP